MFRPRTVPDAGIQGALGISVLPVPALRLGTTALAQGMGLRMQRESPWKRWLLSWTLKVGRISAVGVGGPCGWEGAWWGQMLG